MSERPLRFCDLCYGLDDHPRHVFDGQTITDGRPDLADDFDFAGAPVSAVLQLLEPTTRVRHMDCCAADGCALCQATEAELGGVRGQDLIDALLGGALDGFVAPNESEPSNG